MITASTEDISQNIQEFFKLYFKEYIELIGDNNSEIKKLEEISYPEMDFVFIFKFVRAELDHLKNLDTSIFDKELRVVFNSALKTVSSLIKFKKEYIAAHIIFQNDFTEFNDEAKTINEKFEKAKMEKSINMMKSDSLSKELSSLKDSTEDNKQEQKEINHRLADTLQAIQVAREKLEVISIEKKDFDNKYLPVFLDTYKKVSDKIIYQLIKQIAIFSFSADRDIWKNAARSKKINDFFHEMRGENNMNIGKYMEHHLDHQTSANDKGKDAIKFRKKLIDSIKKIKIFNEKNKDETS